VTAGEPDLDFLDPADREGVIGRLDGYDVLGVVGRGSMGVVLAARDASLNRVVAIKVLAPQLASNATARKWFLREAQAAAAVSHPHVVTIHAVDEWRGLPYLVMQYVKGVSLQQRIEEVGALELREVLRIGVQAAAGLAAAHAQGIVHRDIKPANVLLENSVERVKISDFGLARAIDDASLTDAGVIAGTPQYMAPEQARGEEFDHRADLFSLGSLLWEAATGRPPFRGSTTLAVVRRVADCAPRRADEVCPDVPGWLADIIAKLHAPRPEGRYETAADVAGVLENRLARLQSPRAHADPDVTTIEAASARPSPAPTGTFWRRTDRRLVAAVVVIVLAALGVSEATGTTKVVEFVATVLRIRVPAGTVVLQIDDPTIHVAVDQDGNEITLSSVDGSTPEIKLRPGRHALRVQRDGETVQTRWVTVTQGARELVRVDLEPDEVAQAEGRASRAPEAAPARKSAAASGHWRTYQIQAGDTLFGIAERAYGDGREWPRLIEANPWIAPPNVLRAGVVIYIPEKHDELETPPPPATGAAAGAQAPIDPHPAGALPSAEDRQRAAEAVQRAWHHLEKGALADARMEVDTARSLDPTSPDVWNAVGWVAKNVGEVEAARDAFRRALAIEPTHLGANNGLGFAYLQLGDLERAEAHWLRIAGMVNTPWRNLALLYAAQGRKAEARKWAEKALAIHPQDAELQRILDSSTDEPTAPDALRRLAQKLWGASSARAAVSKAWTLLNRGQTKDAELAFRKLVAKYPADAEPINGLGFCLLSSGRLAEADALFRKALEFDPDHPGALNGLARCLKASGKYDEAIALWKKVDAGGSSVNAGTVGLARAYLELGRYDDAIECYERLIRAAPDNPEFRDGLERARRGAGKAQESETEAGAE